MCNDSSKVKKPNLTVLQSRLGRLFRHSIVGNLERSALGDSIQNKLNKSVKIQPVPLPQPVTRPNTNQTNLFPISEITKSYLEDIYTQRKMK